MNSQYCKTNQQTNRIQPAIQPCSDFVPWQPSPISQLFLNAQPPPFFGKPVPLNITFFQSNIQGRPKKF